MTQLAWQLYREQGAQALWDRCLGYLDLSLEETLALQHRLLEEQLQTLGGSELGWHLFRGEQPRTADDLRRSVPLTNYEDYAPWLATKTESALPEPARMWLRTSGRGGTAKWYPLANGLYEEWRWVGLGLMILSSARGRGDVRFEKHARLLNLTAPPPFASGSLMRSLDEMWPVRQMPPQTSKVDALPFEQRTALAMQGAVEGGVDYVISLASVLAAIADRFGSGPPPRPLRERLGRPRAFARMGAAAVRARAAGRPLLPRDAWSVRGVLTAGMDASLFRERIHQAWGRYPLELFASTEGQGLATQTWDFGGMTVIPTLNFFEFIPDNEYEREDQYPSYQPRTVLLDELEAGRNYEMVITNLRGGPMVRYRTGDIFRVTAMKNSATGVDLPQLASYSRRSDVIDIGGFTRLTEKTVWLAIEMAGVSYTDWTVRKELDGDDPVLRLRLERPAGEPVTAEAAHDLERSIDAALRAVDSDWADMERMANLQPLRVTLISPGSFERYTQQRRAEGADPVQLKPVHMNASDQMIDALVSVGASERGQ